MIGTHRNTQSRTGSETLELRDRLELTDLVYQLGACLDEHRFADIAAIFTDDSNAKTPGGEARGREAIITQAARNHNDHRVYHQVTNVLVDLDGDHARVRSNVVATFVKDQSGPDLVVGTINRYEARRQPEGWRLSRLEVEPVWRQTAD